MVTKAIIGLGNPTLEFCRAHRFDLHELFTSSGKCPSTTRHNAGFAVLNALAGVSSFSYNQSLSANLATVRIGHHSVVLAQPTTWMNDSGVAVKAVLQHFGMSIDDMLVVYDDKDLPLGELRFAHEGSAGGHNGVKSVIAHLEIQKFHRLKFAVGPVPQGVKTIDFVLAPIETEVQPIYDKMIVHAVEATKVWVNEGPTVAKNRYNRRNLVPPSA
jgi:PTH1 family peptidyl-tRNA hydrolase